MDNNEFSRLRVPDASYDFIWAILWSACVILRRVLSFSRPRTNEFYASCVKDIWHAIIFIRIVNITRARLRRCALLTASLTLVLSCLLLTGCNTEELKLNAHVGPPRPVRVL